MDYRDKLICYLRIRDRRNYGGLIVLEILEPGEIDTMKLVDYSKQEGILLVIHK